MVLSAIHNDRPSKPTQAKRLLLHPDLGGCCNTGSVAVPCRCCSLHPDLTAAAAMLPAWRLWAVRVWACLRSGCCSGSGGNLLACCGLSVIQMHPDTMTGYQAHARPKDCAYPSGSGWLLYKQRWCKCITTLAPQP